MHPEPGHLLPTITLARRLHEAGATISYLACAEFRPYLEAEGFNVLDFVEGHSITDGKRSLYEPDKSGWSFWNMLGSGHERCTYLDRRLRCALDTVRPSVIVLDHLLYTSYGALRDGSNPAAPIIHIATSLPRWDEVNVDTGHTRFVLCPSSLELKPFVHKIPNVVYAEPCIDFERAEVTFDMSLLSKNSPLIIVSLGTQTALHSNHSARIHKLLNAANCLPEFQFVVGTGCPISLSMLQGCPDNVVLVRHVPLFTLLKRATVLISHGGLGSLKEAVTCGVPVLILPILFDQPFNAMRVRKLELGEAIFPDKLSASAISAAICRIVNNTAIRDNVRGLQRHFAAVEKEAILGHLLVSLVFEK